MRFSKINEPTKMRPLRNPSGLLPVPSSAKTGVALKAVEAIVKIRALRRFISGTSAHSEAAEQHGRGIERGARAVGLNAPRQRLSEGGLEQQLSLWRLNVFIVGAALWPKDHKISVLISPGDNFVKMPTCTAPRVVQCPAAGPVSGQFEVLTSVDKIS